MAFIQKGHPSSEIKNQFYLTASNRPVVRRSFGRKTTGSIKFASWLQCRYRVCKSYE